MVVMYPEEPALCRLYTWLNSEIFQKIGGICRVKSLACRAPHSNFKCGVRCSAQDARELAQKASERVSVPYPYLSLSQVSQALKSLPSVLGSMWYEKACTVSSTSSHMELYAVLSSLASRFTRTGRLPQYGSHSPPVGRCHIADPQQDDLHCAPPAPCLDAARRRAMRRSAPCSSSSPADQCIPARGPPPCTVPRCYPQRT